MQSFSMVFRHSWSNFATVGLAFAGLCGTSSCSGSDTGNPPGSGGSISVGGTENQTGGTVSAGGVMQTGGIASTGGNLATGGGAATGGMAPTGGASAAGGSLATGGAMATGGAAATGGTVAVGTGGNSNTGGSKPTGGAVATGGAPAATGGASATGGKANGGAAPTGGSKATGGSASSTGGATSAGGGGNTPIKVWMAGDSTMQPCSGTCPCGWGSQFSQVFNSQVTVVNSAVGGRSIQTWLYDPNVTTTMGANGECVINPVTYNSRWTSMLDPNSGMKPGDYLFIEFGINDGDSTCNRHVGTALFQTYLTTMAQAAITRGAHPIFLTSTSAIACNGSTAQANRGFGPQTKAAGTANNVPVIDLTVLSAALYTSLGLCPNSNDYTSTTSKVGLFFCADHTHFEAAGALQIAQTVASALRDQNIPLAAYLK